MGTTLPAILLLFTAVTLLPQTGTAASTVSERIVERFMQLDEDQSGAVTLDEYMTMVAERAEARFNDMDRNHDGAVDARERASYWRKQQAKWYRLNH